MEICIVIHMWLCRSHDYDDHFGFVEFIYKKEEEEEEEGGGVGLLPCWKTRQDIYKSLNFLEPFFQEAYYLNQTCNMAYLRVCLHQRH